MRKPFAVCLFLVAALAVGAPIVTDDQLAAAATGVRVAKIDFVLPEGEKVAEESLATRFFNQPEERRYVGLSTAGWERKWQIFSDALVGKARNQNLDAKSLERCVRALNRGRNRQTMLWPVFETPLFAPGTPREKIDAAEKEANGKYQRALAEREKAPEKWFNEHLAIVPVSAYLARQTKGECWIVVCNWEYASASEVSALGHVIVWALDAKSAAVIGYATCD